MRLLVCGSRSWACKPDLLPYKKWEMDPTCQDFHILIALLDGIWQEEAIGYLTVDLEPFTIIEGGANGADACAAWWATCSPMHSYAKLPEDRTDYSSYPDSPPFEHLQFKADWKTYGKAAGPIRNQKMLTEGQPDLVVAFSHDIENSKGTFDMVDRARRNNIDNYVIG